MDASFNRLTKLTGSVLAIVSFVFIGALLWREREVLVTFRPGISGASILGLCAIAYACLGWVLAEAWRRLLIWAGETNVPAARAQHIYARTQIAKYIPGNVAQFAGRQLIGREAGWSHIGLLLSTIFELVSLVLIAAAIAVITIASGARDIVDSRLLALAATLILAGLVVLPRAGPPLLARRWPDAAKRVAKVKMRDLWPICTYHALFFIACGSILALVVQVVTAEQLAYRQWPALIGLFAITWIISTLTPGAPSGIGIREAALMAGLSFITSTGNAILVATLLRVVTVSGDVLFFTAVGLQRPPHPSL